MLKRVLKAVKARYIAVRSGGPASLMRRATSKSSGKQPDVDERVIKIGAIVGWGRVHGNLDSIRQIEAATRGLAKRKSRGWSGHLAYFPDLARGARPRQARQQLERHLKGSASEITDDAMLEVVAETERSEPELSVAWWIATYIRLFHRAHIKASWLAQKAAARRVLEDMDGLLAREGGGHPLLSAATFLYGGGMDEVFLGEIGRKPGRMSDQMRLDALVTMGRVGDARPLAEAAYTREDRALAARLQGKHIAFVGPARNDLGSGPRIDDSDLVVRTGFMDTEAFHANAAMLGTRTDMSYYNTMKMLHRQADILDTLRKHPAVVAAFRSAWTLGEARKTAPETVLHRYQIFSQVFFGRGFALQHAIRDLLRFSPAKITVYGADFFLSPDTHYADYTARKTDQIYAYLTHNVFDTWQFLKTLKTKNVIEADAVLSPILDMSEAGFATAIADRLREHGGKRSDPTSH